jgi:hypothetical protein
MRAALSAAVDPPPGSASSAPVADTGRPVRGIDDEAAVDGGFLKQTKRRLLRRARNNALYSPTTVYRTRKLD